MPLSLFRAIIVTLICLSTPLVALADSGVLEVYEKQASSNFGAKLFSIFQRPVAFDKSYAVIIGVGKYNSFPQLDAPSSDAIRVRDFLRDEADFDYIVTMTDEKATRENIEKYMENIIPSRIKSNDRFFILLLGTWYYASIHRQQTRLSRFVGIGEGSMGYHDSYASGG